MSIIEKANLLEGYENARLESYKDYSFESDNTFRYSELGKKSKGGLPLIIQRKDGELCETFTEDTHALIIGATRSGKTTGYIIPTIYSKAHQKRQDSMLITDPKGELYAKCSNMLREQGYKIILLNFRDFKHSECWNPLTPIFDKYQKSLQLEDSIAVKKTKDGFCQCFNGREFYSVSELEQELEIERQLIMEDVGNDIDAVASSIMTVTSNDPYWDSSAQQLFKAFLWAMLEDSAPDEDNPNPITKDNFSFRTIFRIMASFTFSKKNENGDRGYFTARPESSRALQLAKEPIISNGDVTRMCVLSSFNTKIAPFKESIASQITCCNTFEMEELVSGEKPVAVFVSYRDEAKVSYVVIQQFITAAYTKLIEIANRSANLRLERPFYFILDEFGNLPKIKDFEITISACGGRNIWFVLVLQSYAQLYNVYDVNVGEIIKDNLNMHVFLGTNNPDTKRAFSEECGHKTILSPLSALNGSGTKPNVFDKDVIPLITISKLNYFEIGECVITRSNAQAVLWSKFERSYLSPEFSTSKNADATEYKSSINFADGKFNYVMLTRKPSKRPDFDEIF